MIQYAISEDIDLFVLLGGQSNAYGNTDGQPPTRPELIGDVNNAFIFDTDDYYTLNYPSNNQGNAFASELSLAYNYTTKTQRPIYIEKVAIPGPAIAQVSGEDDYNVNSGELFPGLKTAYTRLSGKIDSLGVSNPKIVLIWIQGERDARLGFGSQYESNFSDILNELNLVRQLDLVILNVINENIINNNQTPNFTKKNIDSVINAQMNLASNNDYIVNISMNEFTLSIIDNLHYGSEGQEQIGDQLFNIIKTNLGF